MEERPSSHQSNSPTRPGTASGTGNRAQEDDLNDIALPPLQIGDEAPNFTCDSNIGLITLHDLIDGNWSVIITFPKDFDPVSTTEIGQISKMMEEFEGRNVTVLGLSPDNKPNHRAWIEDVQELQDCTVNFPILADVTGEVNQMYGLVRPKAIDPLKSLVECSAIFLIDIDKRIRMMQHYPAVTGRNFYEILRAIDAIQLSTFHQVATPSNWRQGEDVLIPSNISSAAANSIFPKGFLEIKDWFRLTPQPDID